MLQIFLIKFDKKFSLNIYNNVLLHKFAFTYTEVPVRRVWAIDNAIILLCIRDIDMKAKQSLSTRYQKLMESI